MAASYLVAKVRLDIAEAVNTSPALWSSLNFFFATRLQGFTIVLALGFGLLT